MKVGDKTRIMPSIALYDIKLGRLVGLTGEIVELLPSPRNVKGAWVRFEKPFLEEHEWFIPYNSLST